MKNFYLSILFALAVVKINAQSTDSSILPIDATIPCLGTVDPLKEPIDQWNFTVQNESIENLVNLPSRKIIEQQTKLKFDGLNRSQQSTTTSASPITLGLGKNFTGLTGGLEPFDNGTSVSNGNFVVHTINAKMEIKDTLGKVLYSNSLATFLKKSGVFDPRVVYDSYSDRFIVVCAYDYQNEFGVQFACSASNDPTKSWYVYTVKYAGATGTWPFADYPYVGVTQHDIIFQSATPSPYALQIAKAQAYKGGTLKTKTYNLSSKCKEMVCVAEHGRTDVTYYKAYLVGADSWNGGTTLQLVEITDSLNGNPVANTYDITVPSYSLPGDIKQKGTSQVLPAPDTRIQSAVYANGIVHCVMNTNYNNTGFGGIAYYRINVATKKAEVFYYGKANTDLSRPSLALFGTSLSDKTAIIGYHECNQNIYPSVGAVACDDAGNWSNPIILKNGLGYIPKLGTDPRYGDYSSMIRVHNTVTPTAWYSAECGGSGNVRSSWIAQIKRTDYLTSIPKIEIASESFQVFPNPVSDRFTFSMDLKEKLDNANICIYDAEGKLLKKLFEGTLREGENEIGFDKSVLSPGIYFIKVFNQNKEFKAKKIIISNQ